MKPKLDYYSLIKEVRTFAENSGYTVKWVGADTAPHATINTICIPKPDVNWTEEEFLHWRWSVYHEIGHTFPENRDIFPVMKEHNIDMSKQSLFGSMLNQLDDYRNDKSRLGHFLGRDETLSKGLASFMVTKSLPQLEKLSSADIAKANPDVLMADAFRGAILRMRSPWQKDLIGIDDQYLKHFTPDMVEKYKKFMEYEDQINSIKTAEEEYQLVKHLIEEVLGRDPEEEEQKAQGSVGNDGEGSGEDGKGNAPGSSGKDGKDGAEGKDGGKAQKTGGRDDDKRDKRTDAGKIRYEDLVPHNHNDPSGPTFTPLEIDYSGQHSHKSFKIDVDPRVYDFVNDTGTPNSDTEYSSRIPEVSHGLANRIRKLLQVRSQSIKIYGQKRGKLSGKSLHRVTMTETGEYQQKIFTKKVENNILDTAVTILADFSGSMGGSKQVHNIASALLLNDALAKIRLPVEILGFTEGGNKSVMYVFKTHNKQISRDKLKDSMGRASSYMMGNNADGEAILFAYDRLRAQKNKRKLLIVLSDGSPASGRSGDIDGLTKEVIQSIERRNDVEIYGIGIESNNVKRLYKHNRVIKYANELEDAILSVIKEYILE